MDIAALILQFVSKYPFFASALMVIGVLRAINKPLFALLHAYVLSTPSQSDDQLLEKAEQSAFYKSLLFVLDYIGSIKLPGSP